jgi:hypothetical protein
VCEKNWILPTKIIVGKFFSIGQRIFYSFLKFRQLIAPLVLDRWSGDAAFFSSIIIMPNNSGFLLHRWKKGWLGRG